MPNSKARQTISALLSRADIELNGTRPFDIRIKNDKLFERILAEGTLGFGEAYMDGWFEINALDEFADKVFRAKLNEQIKPISLIIPYLTSLISNRQSRRRAFIVGEEHYDIGNELYQKMLDRRMIYTCGYWKNATNLDEAQEAKLDLVCRKLDLKPGEKILDIGCGWGGLLKFAAEKYGINGVGLTVSKEQAELARQNLAGLPIEIQLQDYREATGQYDKIVSLGMFEHVGVKNYRVYLETAHRLLKDNGLFLLHTIGGLRSVSHTDPWIEKYIFPNSMLPSPAQITRAAEGLFVLEDWHNFGADYDKTLMAWWQNFSKNYSTLKDKYDERFYRMWKFYLLGCAGSFRARKNQLWQIVFSKNGVNGVYQRIS